MSTPNSAFRIPNLNSVVRSVAQQIDDFLDRGFVESFAAVAQGFGKANRDFLHVLLCVLRPANEKKLFALGNALVSVGIQADAEQPDYLFPGFFRFLLGRHRVLPEKGKRPFNYTVRTQRWSIAKPGAHTAGLFT